VSLFDGLDFAGWKYRDGFKGHWTAKDGVLAYDGKAEGRNATEKDLWTEKSFGDFVLIADWRLSAKPTLKPHPIVLPNGDFVFDEQGKRKTTPKPDAGDTGIYLRGSRKAQLNIWSQDLGSGEINGYRTDTKQPADVRKACIPVKKADKPFGQWNRFEATVRGDRVTVVLNGETVIPEARLPGLPATGPIGLQHHGDPSEFRNLFIKPLD
jgi:3-keto-disaccharide hydrolase